MDYYQTLVDTSSGDSDSMSVISNVDVLQLTSGSEVIDFVEPGIEYEFNALQRASDQRASKLPSDEKEDNQDANLSSDEKEDNEDANLSSDEKEVDEDAEQTTATACGAASVSTRENGGADLDESRRQTADERAESLTPQTNEGDLSFCELMTDEEYNLFLEKKLQIWERRRKCMAKNLNGLYRSFFRKLNDLATTCKLENDHKNEENAPDILVSTSHTEMMPSCEETMASHEEIEINTEISSTIPKEEDTHSWATNLLMPSCEERRSPVSTLSVYEDEYTYPDSLNVLKLDCNDRQLGPVSTLSVYEDEYTYPDSLNVLKLDGHDRQLGPVSTLSVYEDEYTYPDSLNVLKLDGHDRQLGPVSTLSVYGDEHTCPDSLNVLKLDGHDRQSDLSTDLDI